MATPSPFMASLDAQGLAREAAALLAEALGPTAELHLPGRREHHRQVLARAIELADRVLGASDIPGQAPETIRSARFTLLRAHVARAWDARHGAGQLSLGSQRAPTCEACDDGWRRVEAIVRVAEASALEATRMAAELETPAATKAARAAQEAARDARRLVDERNHAYTFHADPGFSFGEGWYLAAAGVLAEVAIQIEPGKPQTLQVEQFVRDAGLYARLRPYRSRPRANKHLPEIVARAFRADPLSAQRKLRAAFLGHGPVPQAIIDWSRRRLAGASAGKKVLLWVRHGAHHPTRNTAYSELVELTRRVRSFGLEAILVGDAVHDGEVPRGAIDLTLFWKDPVFQGIDMRRAQLQLFEHMKEAACLIGQLGVTTAGMDGPALLGLPTMYLTDAPNPRLGTWVGTVPGYLEVVRDPGYLDRLSDTLQRWATASSRI